MGDYVLVDKAEYERLCQRVFDTIDFEHYKVIADETIQMGADRLSYDIAFSKMALKTLLL